MTLLDPSDYSLILEQLSAQLNSPNIKDRVLVMIELQKESMPVQAAYPLIQQALKDEAVQVRGEADTSLAELLSHASVGLTLLARAEPGSR